MNSLQGCIILVKSCSNCIAMPMFLYIVKYTIFRFDLAKSMY